MENYYSIVQLSPNPNANDKLAVGIIVWYKGSYRWKFSVRKIKAAKQLLRTSDRNVDWVVGQIESRLHGLNQGGCETELLRDNCTAPRFKASFFEYLNRYATNVLRFSAPVKLNLPLENGGLSKLFKILVDGLPEKPEKAERKAGKYSRQEFKKIINTQLVQRLKNVVNTRYTVRKDAHPELYFNLSLDCVGRNGAIYAAKAFDFENVGFSTNDRHIGHYFMLASVFNKKYQPENGENQYFLIADEPSEIGSEVHQQWESVKNMQLIQVVPLEQTETVADKIEEANATPLFQ